MQTEMSGWGNQMPFFNLAERMPIYHYNFIFKGVISVCLRKILQSRQITLDGFCSWNKCQNHKLIGLNY